MIFGRKKRQIARLLVVEDEPLLAFDVEHMLSDEGYEVVATVDRVSDAVAVLSDGKAIDLVLVDLTLADGSGVEVARAANERGIAVLFVTGSCPGEAQAFAQGCLSKPYSQRELVDAIEAIEASRAGNPPKRLPNGFTLFERE